jgi:N-methylhydantoinase A/oxoprolinase/acetone carboxylase beta subunit
MRIGVDTGGTFTDFVCLTAEGLLVDKRRSTPDDPSLAILEGLSHLTRWGAVNEVVHGSTVATNAILERKGARVALVATKGFEDVLFIGRQTRPELYNLFVAPRLPIVEPGLIFGLPERLDAIGKTLTPVNQREIDQIIHLLARQSVDVIAVCLLHSYTNPIHERQVTSRLRRAGFRVCASHEVLAEYREFERWSTTVVNAYVTPIIDRYLGSLELRLGRSGLRIMQSNGGSISAAAARAQAVRTVLSGPAGGVVGARAVAHAAGFRKVISFDMGGTSTDVSLIDGEAAMTTDSVIGDFPVRLPMIDVHTVGAGGGSIAAVDSGGALRVGPQSAGANPGPACYGAGTELTVTDANLLLGRIDPDYFLGGRMALDFRRASEVAVETAALLRITVPQLAEGIIAVANANMQRAMRVVSVERGHDPRDFALVAFGGAGGMHACEIAQQLDIRTVVVPRHAGVLSALGMLLADVTKDYSASVLQPSDSINFVALQRRFKPLITEAQQVLKTEGFDRSTQLIQRLVDVRYVGQSYEITLPFSKDYIRDFHRRHAQLYGYSNPEMRTESVNLRLSASGITHKPKLPCGRLRNVLAKPVSFRQARFKGRMLRTGFFRWADLIPGAHAAGPAVVTGAEATVVVPPAFDFSVDGFGNLIIWES